MLMLLMGVLAALIGGSAALSRNEVEDRPKGQYEMPQTMLGGGAYTQSVSMEPYSELKYRHIVRQAYDYSCGSAALTTLLDYYLGRNLEERQVMEGLIKYGEADKIVQRRGFSLLDMKRYAAALGYKSGGFRAEFSDLDSLEHPALVPIHYAGFKHFVVVRDVYNDHVFVADPALGNISFTRARFEDIWDQNVLFVIYPSGQEPKNALALQDNDMRLVDDRTVSLLAFREFPEMSKLTQNQIGEAATKGDVQYIRRN